MEEQRLAHQVWAPTNYHYILEAEFFQKKWRGGKIMADEAAPLELPSWALDAINEADQLLDSAFTTLTPYFVSVRYFFYPRPCNQQLRLRRCCLHAQVSDAWNAWLAIARENTPVFDLNFLFDYTPKVCPPLFHTHHAARRCLSHFEFFF